MISFLLKGKEAGRNWIHPLREKNVSTGTKFAGFFFFNPADGGAVVLGCVCYTTAEIERSFGLFIL